MAGGLAQLAKAVLVGTTLAALINCGGDVRKDPFVVDRFKEIQGQLDKVKDLPLKVQDLDQDVTVLKQEITKAQGAGGVAPARLQDLETRLAALEAQIKNLSKAGPAAPPAAGPKAAPTPFPPAPTQAPPKVTPIGPGAPPAAGPKATPMNLKTAPGAPGTTATMKAGKGGPPKLVQPKLPLTGRAPKKGEVGFTARGSYYIVQDGDTLEAIAQKKGVPLEAILQANTFLRPDSVLDPGAPIWIPTPAK